MLYSRRRAKIAEHVVPEVLLQVDNLDAYLGRHWSAESLASGSASGSSVGAGVGHGCSSIMKLMPEACTRYASSCRLKWHLSTPHSISRTFRKLLRCRATVTVHLSRAPVTAPTCVVSWTRSGAAMPVQAPQVLQHCIISPGPKTRMPVHLRPSGSVSFGHRYASGLLSTSTFSITYRPPLPSLHDPRTVLTVHHYDLRSAIGDRRAALGQVAFVVIRP